MEPVESALESLGLALPVAAAPGGNYVPYVRWGELLFLAGVISTRNGEVISGTVGVDKTIEEAYDAAMLRVIGIGHDQAGAWQP
jgi:enamine deaminase RidA (YjgF/YER057c/UK114 family)